MRLLELLKVLSPELKLIIEYDDREILISGYSADYVKQQADFFDTIGDDTYQHLQVKDVNVIDYNGSQALNIVIYREDDKNDLV